MKKHFTPKKAQSNIGKMLRRCLGMSLIFASLITGSLKAQNSDIDPGEISGGSNNPLVYHRICTGQYKFDDILSKRAGKSKSGKKIYYTWFVEVPGKAKKALKIISQFNGKVVVLGMSESVNFSQLGGTVDFYSVCKDVLDNKNTEMPNQLKFYRGAQTTLAWGKIEDCVLTNPITFVLTPEDKVTGGGGDIEISNYINKCEPATAMLESVWSPIFNDGQAKWQSSTDNKIWRDATTYSPINKVQKYMAANLGRETTYRMALKSNKSACKQESYSNQAKVMVIPKPVITTEQNIVIYNSDIQNWGAIKYLTASPGGGVFEHVSGIGNVYKLFATKYKYLLSLTSSDIFQIKSKPRNVTVSYTPDNVCANKHKITKTFTITYTDLSTNGVVSTFDGDLLSLSEKGGRKANEDFGFELAFSEFTSVTYPNPVTNELTLKYFSDQDGGELNINVVDMQGLPQLNQKVTTTLGLNVITLDLTKLKEGIYTLKTLQGNKLSTKKITKLVE